MKNTFVLAAYAPYFISTVGLANGRVIEATVHADVDGIFKIALGEKNEQSVTLTAGSRTQLVP